jgi:ABC-type Zn uptake system ZnuABC Zn-binding protein ZnuA
MRSKTMQTCFILRHLGCVLSVLCVLATGTLQAQEKLHIVATTEHYGAIVRRIGQERVQVHDLVKGFQNPHAVEVKPSYSVYLNRADLLVTNGQLLEIGWLDMALINARNEHILEGASGYVDCSVGVDIIPYELQEIQGTPLFMLSLSTGGTTAIGNHHYWLDPANTAIIAKNIADKLAEADPQHATLYQNNYAQLASSLEAKIQQWDAMMAPFRGIPIVSYHRSWNYLARRHGLQLVGYVEPKETIPPSAAEMAALVARMRKQGVKIVLAESYQNRTLVTEVARLSGATPLILPDSVNAEGGIADVLQLFDTIYQALTHALQAAKPS